MRRLTPTHLRAFRTLTLLLLQAAFVLVGQYHDIVMLWRFTTKRLDEIPAKGKRNSYFRRVEKCEQQHRAWQPRRLLAGKCVLLTGLAGA